MQKRHSIIFIFLFYAIFLVFLFCFLFNLYYGQEETLVTRYYHTPPPSATSQPPSTREHWKITRTEPKPESSFVITPEIEAMLDLNCVTPHIYVLGSIYMSTVHEPQADDFITALPSDYQFYGLIETQTKSGGTVASHEFEANGYRVGTPIYINEEDLSIIYLYLETKYGWKYVKFYLYNE